MKKYMNEPADYRFTDEDVIKEYQLYGDVKKVTAVFYIDCKSVKEILKRNGEV